MTIIGHFYQNTVLKPNQSLIQCVCHNYIHHLHCNKNNKQSDRPTAQIALLRWAGTMSVKCTSSAIRWANIIFQRWSNVVCPDSQRWLNVLLQEIDSTLGQHLYDIRPTVNFGHNCRFLIPTLAKRLSNVSSMTTSRSETDQRVGQLQHLVNVGIKHRQLRPGHTSAA